MKCVHHCLICGDTVPTFLTTPLLQDENGELNSCCEACANKNFPGWVEEDEDDLDRCEEKSP